LHAARRHARPAVRRARRLSSCHPVRLWSVNFDEHHYRQPAAGVASFVQRKACRADTACGCASTAAESTCVKQEDEVLIGMLTVRETILYAARLRLGGGGPSPAAVADGLASDLGLTEAPDTHRHRHRWAFSCSFAAFSSLAASCLGRCSSKWRTSCRLKRTHSSASCTTSSTAAGTCPCSRQPGACPPQLGGAECRMSGQDVLTCWSIPAWGKWDAAGQLELAAWAVSYRALFYASCKLTEWRSRGCGH